MVSKVYSAVLTGIKAELVTIEAAISGGLPSTDIIGLGDKTIAEAAKRSRTAIINSGIDYPLGRVVINIAPADQRKRGSQLDLAIAVSVLAASGKIFSGDLEKYCFAGELSLDGTLKGVGGILAMASEAVNRGRTVIIPRENEKETSLIKGGTIFSASSLAEVIDFINKKGRLKKVKRLDMSEIDQAVPDPGLDFSDIHGMEQAKRAMTIAAAGGHGIFMLGSPATGKTMMAERLPSILPDMDQEEMTEVTSVYSAAGLLSEKEPFITRRPFRKPHSSITQAALLGGGFYPSPGEISLAHRGVLFMDEFAEFDRNVIDSLRLPLEKKMIRINRRGYSYDFPADFLFAAASNPCPCGYYGDKTHECRCTQGQIDRYRSRIAGPVIDRIDICLNMTSTLYEELKSSCNTSSSEMKEDVERARLAQYKRYGRKVLNSAVPDSTAENFIEPGSSSEMLLESAYGKMGLDPRTLGKVRRISRTIADIDGLPEVTDQCVLEAIQYRFDPR